MHRVDAPGNDNNRFSAGDPAKGIWPTELDADWHNAVQEAICRVIEGAGLPLEKGNDDQLRDAIAARIAAEMTAAQILAKLLTVDGSGSGLDADLLDGLEGAVFLRRLNEVWNTDAEGNPRFYFQRAANGGRTYMRYKGQVVLTPDDSRYPVTVDENGVIASTGGFWHGASLVWDAGNDGAGSGLDADLHRGLTPDQVVSLARVLAALGYVPANAAGQTFTGDVKVSRTGANARILLENGTSGKRASLAMQTDDNLVLYLTEADGDHPIFSVRSAAGPLNFMVPLQVSGGLVWHSGNDGSGSSLDGDLWRGLDPAGFFATYFPSGTTNGWNWRKWPDGQGGTMIRMARVSDPFLSQAAYQTWEYPFALSELTECGATAELIQNNTSSDQVPQIFNPTTTKITINMQDMAGSTTWPIKARIVVEGRL